MNMGKMFSRAIATAAFAAFVAAAAFATPAAGTGISITDALGRKVEFAKAPQRIAVTGKALFMVADAIYLFPEASSRIVALGNTAQGKLSFSKAIDPRYGDKIALDNSAGAEAIAAAKPDAVILKSSMAGSTGKAVEAIGIPVVYVDFELPEQYERDIANLGALFENSERADEIIAMYKARTDRIAKALAGLAEGKKPKALVLYYTEQGGAVSFNVPPLGWMQSVQVRLAGGDPVWKDAQLGQGWTKASIEQIAAWNPDQIFLIAYFSDLDSVIAKLKADPQWAGLAAVKKGALYGFAGDYYSYDQPDPRWILGLDWLASKLHPELLPGFDMKKEVRDFYRDFYGMDDAAYASVITPYLQGALR
jgi:ABC-type Fe3+-hydroxamate transport system, periplasmic component